MYNSTMWLNAEITLHRVQYNVSLKIITIRVQYCKLGFTWLSSSENWSMSDTDIPSSPRSSRDTTGKFFSDKKKAN